MLDRYSTTMMKNIWSDKSKYVNWIEIEKALLLLFVENGVLSKTVYYKDPSPSKHVDAIMAKSKHLEKTYRHDIEAFVRALREYMPNCKNHVHKGLTSSDIKDTALAMSIQESCDTLLIDLGLLLKVLNKKMNEYKQCPILGRTHGMIAQPMSLGLKFAGYYQMIVRCKKRIRLARSSGAYGKMSGAVGGCSFLTPEDEKFILDDLDIQVEPIATQIVPRDRHADVIMNVAITAECIAKIATDIRLLHQSEIADISECFTKDQKGSSAMPHKKNPIMCERLCGLARVVRGSTHTALANIALWNERDISHSSAERLIFPQVFGLVDYMIINMVCIINNLYINRSNIINSIISSAPLWSSQRVVDVLVENGMDRTVAYDIVQAETIRPARKVKYIDRLMNNPGLMSIINKDKLRKRLVKCFDYSYFLRHTDKLYERLDGNKV